MYYICLLCLIMCLICCMFQTTKCLFWVCKVDIIFVVFYRFSWCCDFLFYIYNTGFDMDYTLLFKYNSIKSIKCNNLWYKLYNIIKNMRCISLYGCKCHNHVTFFLFYFFFFTLFFFYACCNRDIYNVYGLFTTIILLQVLISSIIDKLAKFIDILHVTIRFKDDSMI